MFVPISNCTCEQSVCDCIHIVPTFSVRCRYLFNANSGNSKIANRELAQMKVFFKEVTDAMKVVGFDDEVSAILWQSHVTHCTVMVLVQ